MSEGDYTPRSVRPKPLTRKQLREMQERFEKASANIEHIKELEKKHESGDVENPEWI